MLTLRRRNAGNAFIGKIESEPSALLEEPAVRFEPTRRARSGQESPMQLKTQSPPKSKAKVGVESPAQAKSPPKSKAKVGRVLSQVPVPGLL